MKERKATPASWKQGQSGNPNGRPKLPPELKQAIKMNKIKFQELLLKYLKIPTPELTKIVKAKEVSSLDMIVISIILNGIKKGDERKLEFLMNRIVGKVKDEVEVSGSLHSAIVDQLEDDS